MGQISLLLSSSQSVKFQQSEKKNLFGLHCGALWSMMNCLVMTNILVTLQHSPMFMKISFVILLVIGTEFNFTLSSPVIQENKTRPNPHFRIKGKKQPNGQFAYGWRISCDCAKLVMYWYLLPSVLSYFEQYQ